MRHKSKADFDPIKFTPKRISNKLDIDLDELSAYFKDNHTLNDCAIKYGCSTATIKRKLRLAEVDTSIYNHSKLSKSRTDAKVVKYSLTDEQLRELYIDSNLDCKTIAETHNPPLHYNVIRKHVRRLGLTKTRKMVARSMSARHIRNHGLRHPSQRQDVITKTRSSSIKAEYVDKIGRQHKFRSLHELGYALLLDTLNCEWYYEEMSIPYVDAISGKHRIYIIDFTIVNGDDIDWVEVKPNNSMIPNDKRVYASRRAEAAGVTYRGLTDEERIQSKLILSNKFNRVSFSYCKPRSSAKKITYYFLNNSSAVKYKLPGWRGLEPRQLGVNLWARTFCRRQ